MGKRSNFTRRKEDAYDTPIEAVLPLLPHLPPATRFIEPCAGRGDLVAHLEQAGHKCVGAFDIKPRAEGIIKGDALKFRAAKHYYASDMIITNPPWSRELLHAMIFNFYWQRPTWLLFDADWKHTEQAQPYLPMIRDTVSIGRVRWIEGTKHKGNDNCEWYYLDATGHKIGFQGREWT